MEQKAAEITGYYSDDEALEKLRMRLKTPSMRAKTVAATKHTTQTDEHNDQLKSIPSCRP
jgi:hypothetical protein